MRAHTHKMWRCQPLAASHNDKVFDVELRIINYNHLLSSYNEENEKWTRIPFFTLFTRLSDAVGLNIYSKHNAHINVRYIFLTKSLNSSETPYALSTPSFYPFGAMRLRVPPFDDAVVSNSRVQLAYKGKHLP